MIEKALRAGFFILILGKCSGRKYSRARGTKAVQISRMWLRALGIGRRICEF